MIKPVLKYLDIVEIKDESKGSLLAVLLILEKRGLRGLNIFIFV